MKPIDLERNSYILPHFLYDVMLLQDQTSTVALSAHAVPACVHQTAIGRESCLCTPDCHRTRTPRTHSCPRRSGLPSEEKAAEYGMPLASVNKVLARTARCLLTSSHQAYPAHHRRLDDAREARDEVLVRHEPRPVPIVHVLPAKRLLLLFASHVWIPHVVVQNINIIAVIL